MKIQVIVAAMALCFALHPAAADYEPTKQDSGWVPLFNGVDMDGLYLHLSDFVVEDGALKCENCDRGYVRTEEMYSHYHVRVSYQFLGNTAQGNGGLLYHLTSDSAVGRAVWPTCLENQVGPDQSGDLILLGNSQATVEVDGSGDTYSEGGTPTDFDNTRRIFTPIFASGEFDSQDDWNVLENRVWGDSLIEHIINGNTVLRATGLTHNEGSEPMDHGYTTVQYHGGSLQYKDWEIRFFPEDEHYSMYVKGCRDTAYVEYNADANMHVDSMCITEKGTSIGNAAGSLAPGIVTAKGNRITVHTEGTHILSVYDLSGSHIVTRQSSGPVTYTLSQELTSGIYLVKLHTSRGQTIRKITGLSL